MNSSQFKIEPLPIIGPYNVQRFKQFGPEDSANFYIVKGTNTKRPFAMYPTFGRAHINYLGINRLIFGAEPRGIFRSVNYWYAVVGNTIYRIDSFYNVLDISSAQLQSSAGNIFFAYLVVNSITFACFTDDEKIYIYREDTGIFYTVTDSNAPGNATVDGVLTKPGFIVAFGNRIAVSVFGSSQFSLSQINLGGNAFDPATCFTPAVFAQENGIIRQMGVLNNTLYIFTDFTTGVWSNTIATFAATNTTFPWKKSTAYDWNFGLADPLSLDINFGYMVFLARNSNGLLQVMRSQGDEPKPISNEAIDVLFQRYANRLDNGSPFLEGISDGFLYQYENTIFYRLSAGAYNNYGILDLTSSANSIEYNFKTDSWHRVIELNGERNRIQKHVFFNNKHLVTVSGEETVYEMSGEFYTNELRNKEVTDPQDIDAYIKYPFRYERITPIISQDDYSEFETEYAEIDFVWGDSNINFSIGPFENAQFLIAEAPDINGNPVYIVADMDENGNPIYLISEQGNTPHINESIYNNIYKPHIELYWSDDGGISFYPADVREFSQQGVYQWRMRWYQLGVSRNRVYKLICVSPVPIVILGGVMNVRRVSGGAN